MSKLEENVAKGNSLLAQLNSILENQLQMQQENKRRLDLTESSINVIINAFNALEERVRTLENLYKAKQQNQTDSKLHQELPISLVPVAPKRRRIKPPTEDNSRPYTREERLRRKIKKTS